MVQNWLPYRGTNGAGVQCPATAWNGLVAAQRLARCPPCSCQAVLVSLRPNFRRKCGKASLRETHHRYIRPCPKTWLQMRRGYDPNASQGEKPTGDSFYADRKSTRLNSSH